MSAAPSRPLRVFLCHASQDKLAVRELYKRLAVEKWMEPWLDEESLLPGQDFDLEIDKATREADAIVICLSKASVAKEGYVNKEIRRALQIADEKLPGTIYLIPLRLDDCTPAFERLRQLHWVDYFAANGYEKLLKALRARASALNIEFQDNHVEPIIEANPIDFEGEGFDLYKFIAIEPQKKSRISDAFWIRFSRFFTRTVLQRNKEVSYPFWIGKYPVTNAQYERFLNAPDFASSVYWENSQLIKAVGYRASNWLQSELEKANSKVLWPMYWDHDGIGKANPNHPIVGISWYEASVYCMWLFQNWNVLLESTANPLLRPAAIHVPVENEWVIAAGGDKPTGRYPWDQTGSKTLFLDEILQRANVKECGIGRTTPVDAYPLGKSRCGVMDMAGNVWEWQDAWINDNLLSVKGGSFDSSALNARVLSSDIAALYTRRAEIGFRVVVLPQVLPSTRS